MDNFELYYRLNKNNRSKKITGVPPLSFVSNGENLSDCKIYGASGGVGDRTVNLFDAKNSTYGDGTYWVNAKTLSPKGNYYGSSVIDVTSGETITRSFTETSANYFMREDGSTMVVSDTGSRENGVTIIIPDDCIRYVFNIPNSIDPNTIQVVVGSQLPETYEPYGYKIPIVVAGKNLFDENTVTEDAFLYVNDGTVRKSSGGTANVSGYIPTKKSRKYILTFSAEFVPSGFTTVACYYDTSKQYTQQRDAFATATSSERYFFELVPQNDGYIRVKYPSSAFNLQVEDSDSATDYEPHYESQTAAIYLNEPLAEGESISSRSAGVSIPTINGTTILSVDTAVQPSRIDVALTSKQSKMADSMLKYFSYKYGILKRAGLHI